MGYVAAKAFRTGGRLYNVGDPVPQRTMQEAGRRLMHHAWVVKEGEAKPVAEPEKATEDDEVAYKAPKKKAASKKKAKAKKN